MADTQGIRAGRAFVELLADDSKLQAGLKKAAARLKGWGKAVTGAGKKLTMIGGAIVAPMMLAARAFASSGDQLADRSAFGFVAVENFRGPPSREHGPQFPREVDGVLDSGIHAKAAHRDPYVGRVAT